MTNGIFVVEELFDCWEVSKNWNNHDFSEFFHQKIKGNNPIINEKEGMEWAEYVIKSTLRRDRNNLSVILWSIGNEVPGASHHPDLAKTMILWAREIDQTRTYTIGEMDVGGNPARCEAIASIGGIVRCNYGGMDKIDDAKKNMVSHISLNLIPFLIPEVYMLLLMELLMENIKLETFI